eukprot:scaffold6308_cov111-Isochrysis_galbana.AAC.5
MAYGSTAIPMALMASRTAAIAPSWAAGWSERPSAGSAVRHSRWTDRDSRLGVAQKAAAQRAAKRRVGGPAGSCAMSRESTRGRSKEAASASAGGRWGSSAVQHARDVASAGDAGGGGAAAAATASAMAAAVGRARSCQSAGSRSNSAGANSLQHARSTRSPPTAARDAIATSSAAAVSAVLMAASGSGREPKKEQTLASTLSAGWPLSVAGRARSSRSSEARAAAARYWEEGGKAVVGCSGCGTDWWVGRRGACGRMRACAWGGTCGVGAPVKTICIRALMRGDTFSGRHPSETTASAAAARIWMGGGAQVG